MQRVKTVCLAAMLAVFFHGAVRADDRASCEANKGTFLIGIVTQDAQYQPESRYAGGEIQGVKLSHTRLFVKVDGQSAIYEVDIDNVFATGYVKNQAQVPAGLQVLKKDAKVELCGQTYNDNGKLGIHWVHTNCGKTPNPKRPNGWVRVLDADGKAGPNLESDQNYCFLWGSGSR